MNYKLNKFDWLVEAHDKQTNIKFRNSFSKSKRMSFKITIFAYSFDVENGKTRIGAEEATAASPECAYVKIWERKWNSSEFQSAMVARRCVLGHNVIIVQKVSIMHCSDSE